MVYTAVSSRVLRREEIAGNLPSSLNDPLQHFESEARVWHPLGDEATCAEIKGCFPSPEERRCYKLVEIEARNFEREKTLDLKT